MPPRKRRIFLIRPDDTEDTVAAAVESFFALASFPFERFSIELFSRRKERWRMRA
jgi:hypothetical protein